MQGQNVIRAILFVVFFSIGAASLGFAILCDELVQHYRNADLVRSAEKSLERLKSLDRDYAEVLRRLQLDPNDPNSVKHLAPVTLGPGHQDPNTVYPRATAESLAAAERALANGSDNGGSAQSQSSLPWWLTRCSEPRRKTALLICGVALVLTSLVCFGPRRDIE